MKISKRIISLLLVVVFMLTAIFSVSAVSVNQAVAKAEVDVAEVTTVDYELADNVQNGVILHCWN